MKRLFFLLPCIVFFSCHKSNLEYEKDFDKSYRTFLSFKEKTGDTYQFSLVGGSWVGVGWETRLTVLHGHVSKRDFKYTLSPDFHGSIPDSAMQWSEMDVTLGSHVNTAAAGLITLDSVYEQARTEWLIKRSGAKVYFEAKNDGMISTAGYIDDNCQDDCFRGIDVRSIVGY